MSSPILTLDERVFIPPSATTVTVAGSPARVHRRHAVEVLAPESAARQCRCRAAVSRFDRSYEGIEPADMTSRS